jgi:hypothetical protein
MEHQVKIVAKAAFYHLRLIARIRRFLNQSAAKALVHAFVMLTTATPCFPAYPRKPPHAYRGFKMPPRLIFRRGRRESTSPPLKELKWLPVKHRIIFKATTFAFRCHLCPPLATVYLSFLLTTQPDP